MTLLRYELDTRARILLVKFPEGWARTQNGFYTSAEELIVLEGTLEMSGLTIIAGDYGYFPAGWLRHDMRAPTEVLAFARFAGPARWTLGDDGSGDHTLRSLATTHPDHETPTGVGLSTTLHTQDPHDPSTSLLVEGITPAVATSPTDLLDLTTFDWHWIDQGATIPAVPRAFQRTREASS